MASFSASKFEVMRHEVREKPQNPWEHDCAKGVEDQYTGFKPGTDTSDGTSEPWTSTRREFH
jgi:hypothetical protein